MSLLSDMFGGGAEALQYCAPMPSFNVPSFNVVMGPTAPWTPDAPTVEGVYWMRLPSVPAIAVFVKQRFDGNGYYQFGEGLHSPIPANALWQGPITPGDVEGA